MTAADVLTIAASVVIVPFWFALSVMAYDAHRRESRTYHRSRAHHPTNPERINP